MKNLKKVLALVVALTMVLGTVAFAAFTDVTVEDDEFTAVSTLSSLGILNGYEDGSFKPDGDITRAEFCTVVCKALGYEAAAGATNFSDVPADHWAAGYINTCYGAKIVAGMGDGTFAPNANVTYEQAVKMLVVALGYEPMAAQKGGWPTGYMVVANTYGMTKGISVASQSAAASRGVVAELVYNALDIPMMEQTGFGTNTEFTILDGTNNKDYKTLLTGLDVAKLEGKVVGTPIITADTEVALDEVRYCYTEVEGNEYLEEKLDGEDCYDITLKVAEDVNAADYFQYASTVYAREYAKNKFEIIAIMPGAESETLELTREMIEEDTIEATKFEYLESDAASKTTKVNVDADAAYYFNYAMIEDATLADAFAEADDLADVLNTAVDVEITLIENDGNNKYDAVIVKAYAYDVIKTIDEDATQFETYEGEDFIFDFEEEEVLFTFLDKDGEAIEYEDFAEEDVIAYILDDGDYADYDFIEIVDLGANTVTGLVDGKGSDYVEIDGTKYDSVFDIEIGTEGVFYLTRTGKIFKAEADKTTSYNYAIVLAAAEDANSLSGDAFQVKLLTRNNEIIIYNLRDNLAKNVPAFLTDIEDAGAADIDEIKADIANRLVTFKLDSKNAIREIEQVEGLASFVKSGDTAEYDLDGETLGKASVVASTVVFNLDVNSVDSVSAAGIGYLVNEAEYAGVYVENDDDEATAIILTNAGSAIDFNQDLAIVAEVTEMKVNEGADDAKKIKYYVSGDRELKEIIVVDDGDTTEFVNGDYADIAIGDAIMFTENEGTAVAYATIATIKNGIYVLDTAYLATVAGALEKADVEFKVGYIKDWESLTAGTKLTTGDEDYAPIIRSSSNDYSVEEKRGDNTINVGQWKVAKKVTKMAEGDTAANFFVAKEVKGKVADIIVIADKAEIGY